VGEPEKLEEKGEEGGVGGGVGGGGGLCDAVKGRKNVGWIAGFFGKRRYKRSGPTLGRKDRGYGWLAPGQVESSKVGNGSQKGVKGMGKP